MALTEYPLLVVGPSVGTGGKLVAPSQPPTSAVRTRPVKTVPERNGSFVTDLLAVHTQVDPAVFEADTRALTVFAARELGTVSVAPVAPDMAVHPVGRKLDAAVTSPTQLNH
jgi:hypothetical protein